MKTFRFIAVCAALFAVGCSQFQDADEKVSISTTHQRYYASLDEETKTYVEDNKYLRWHAEDEISVFPTHTTNVRYQFEGETGDKSGSFKTLEADAVTGTPLNYTYAVYPYNSTNSISEEGVLSVTLPATQLYNKHSFGKGANTEVAVSESAVSDKLFFKNACGYLKLRLYGESQEIKSVTLRGNNSEKISGAATITATFEGVPEVVMGEGATTDVVIICEEGVVLGATAEEATEFWFVLPPMTFEKGFTVYVSGEVREMKQSTSNSVTIERNKILPMQTLKVEPNITISNRKIYYTSSDGKVVTPYKTDVFGANIISNTYENGQGVIEFDGEVTQIGDYAFRGCSKLTSVTIPDSVTSIGGYAFYSCTKLTSVTIPDSVTSIGNFAFQSCRLLTDVTIPNSVTSIGENAFYDCTSLTSAIIGNGVTLIGGGAFVNCTSLTSITIPDSVTLIGSCVFQGCTSLTSITIPDSVTTINLGAFQGCKSLRQVTLPNNITTIANQLFSKCPALSEITIPDSVTKIGSWAFSECSSLKSITIPDSVTSIGSNAFRDCTSLKAFYGKFASTDNCCLIVNGVLKAFAIGCGATEYTIPDSVTKIGVNAFYGCDSLTSITIPDSVTSIGEWAFYNCTSLTSITIPNSVTSIGYLAFGECTSLTSISIPNSIISLGGAAFAACTSLASFYGKFASEDNRYLIVDGVLNSFAPAGLTEYTIPDSVTSIGERAFYECTSLTSVTIGNSVTSIGSGAFNSCTSLKEVYCKPITPPTGGNGMFYSNASGRKIYVPTASVDAYKAAQYWRDYKLYIVGYDF